MKNIHIHNVSKSNIMCEWRYMFFRLLHTQIQIKRKHCGTVCNQLNNKRYWNSEYMNKFCYEWSSVITSYCKRIENLYLICIQRVILVSNTLTHTFNESTREREIHSTARNVNSSCVRSLGRNNHSVYKLEKHLILYLVLLIFPWQNV